MQNLAQEQSAGRQGSTKVLWTLSFPLRPCPANLLCAVLSSGLDIISGRPASPATGIGAVMATDVVVMPVSRQRPLYRPVNRTAERVFYTGMAVLLCVCVYI